MPNVKDPNMLTVPGGYNVRETINSSLPSTPACVAVNRSGAFPATRGGYVAGLVTKAVDKAGVALGICVNGYAIARVEAAQVVAVDAPVAFSLAGEAITATGTFYQLGRAVTATDGTGTAVAPHYILVHVGANTAVL